MTDVQTPAHPERVDRFRVLGKIGEGGMGSVYEAVDDRLGRHVALKRITGGPPDEQARQRLWREARAAAGVSHPNVCQVYDAGEEQGGLWIAMELLEGEPLSARMSRGPVPLDEALRISLGILDALTVLHARGIVHRDLKPSNVFLTPHGVKVLDFGLALPTVRSPGESSARLTETGMFLGTPGFMAPEQWSGGAVGPSADVFSLGAILYEMVAGRPAFQGATVLDVWHAALHDDPPALVGGAAVESVDRSIQRALSKRPEDRPSAGDLARDLRQTLAAGAEDQVPRVRTAKRLLVLPFRLLRPDPEVDFLSLALPDAIATSLAVLPSIVVRSAHVGARFQGHESDLARIAQEAQVDCVLLGTVLRGGSRIRATAQLVEAPSGTVLWSGSAESAQEDLFHLQDELAQRIVDSIEAPLGGRGRRTALQRDVPANPQAYEVFLRAERLAHSSSTMADARDLFRRCLDLDPGYAPAWARLARVYRVLAKYGRGDGRENLRLAEEAFRRALELNPDLSVAHNLFAYFEVEEQGRPQAALTRLLERLHLREDPELLAGLVLACRFCGLLDASVAADRRARRLDPGIRTSVAFTHWMRGEYETAMAQEDQDIPWVRHYALPMLGREAEAVAGLREVEGRMAEPMLRAMLRGIRATLEGNREESVEAHRRVIDLGFHDPEGLYFGARDVARVGDLDFAFAVLERAVKGGFFLPQVLSADPWLEPMRKDARFAPVLGVATAGRDQAVAIFRRLDGEHLLGSPAS